MVTCSVCELTFGAGTHGCGGITNHFAQHLACRPDAELPAGYGEATGVYEHVLRKLDEVYGGGYSARLVLDPAPMEQDIEAQVKEESKTPCGWHPNCIGVCDDRLMHLVAFTPDADVQTHFVASLPLFARRLHKAGKTDAHAFILLLEWPETWLAALIASFPEVERGGADAARGRNKFAAHYEVAARVSALQRRIVEARKTREAGGREVWLDEQKQAS